MLNNVNFKRILLTFKRHIQAQKNQIKPLIMKKISLFLITAAYFAVNLQAHASSLGTPAPFADANVRK